MNDLDYIVGLMRTERDAVGFIPSTKIRDYWIPKNLYIIQRDSAGRRRGYILHGPPKFGQTLRIHQALIDYDYRLYGFGILAVRTVVDRADQVRATRILLRCANDLDANVFWRANGFRLIKTQPGGAKRKRVINTYVLELSPTENQQQEHAAYVASSEPNWISQVGLCGLSFQ